MLLMSFPWQVKRVLALSDLYFVQEIDGEYLLRSHLIDELDLQSVSKASGSSLNFSCLYLIKLYGMWDGHVSVWEQVCGRGVAGWLG